MFNPDYPTAGGSFLRSTAGYNQTQANPFDSMYYGGGNPFNTMYQQNNDSRRNIGCFNQQPMMAQHPSFATQQQQLTEQQLQPFSSYPPAYPQQQQVQNMGGIPSTGLNANLNSRRNNVAPIMASTQPQQPTVATTAIPQQQVFNPYASYMNNMNGCNDPALAALYNVNITPFDRKSCWDNAYTQCRPETPVINWSQYSQQQSLTNLNPAAQYSAYMQQPHYPTMMAAPQQSYPSTDKTWLEIAKNNWGV